MTFHGFPQELVLEAKVLFEQIGERTQNGPRGVRGGLVNEGSQSRVFAARSGDQFVLPLLVELGQDRLLFGAQLGLELVPQSSYCLLGIGESTRPIASAGDPTCQTSLAIVVGGQSAQPIVACR
jgi:hypothetical protein